MSKKPLIKTNPHLKDPREMWKHIITSVTSSTAVEGVNISSTRILEEYEKRVGSISPSEKKKLSRLGR